MHPDTIIRSKIRFFKLANMASNQNELRKSHVQLNAFCGCKGIQALTRAERSVATDAYRERRLGAAYRVQRHAAAGWE